MPESNETRAPLELTGGGSPSESGTLQPQSIGVCPRCVYDLAGVSTTTCPECGADIPAEFERRGAPKRVWPIIVVWTLCLLGWGYGAFAMQSVYAYYTGSPIGLDPAWMLIHLAAVLSAAGLIVTLVFRRALRTAPKGRYWWLATPGLILLGIFAAIFLLVAAG